MKGTGSDRGGNVGCDELFNFRVDVDVEVDGGVQLVAYANII